MIFVYEKNVMIEVLLGTINVNNYDVNIRVKE